jgi:hypothetical protein
VKQKNMFISGIPFKDLFCIISTKYYYSIDIWLLTLKKERWYPLRMWVTSMFKKFHNRGLNDESVPCQQGFAFLNFDCDLELEGE